MAIRTQIRTRVDGPLRRKLYQKSPIVKTRAHFSNGFFWSCLRKHFVCVLLLITDLN
jgi:hypothetical protein